MDLRTVVTVSALLLVTAVQCSPLTDVQLPESATNGTEASFPAEANRTTSDCYCPSASTAVSAPTSSPSSPAPAVGLLTIRWTGTCDGDVNLVLHNSSSPVCHGSEASVRSLLGNVCETKKGCKDTPRWDRGRPTVNNGYYIAEGRAKEGSGCERLRVKCTGEGLADVKGQLHAYKVVTALLCCVLLVLLLIRFTRPTVKALQKRLSDRRQNRWVGPTQSHSVSYHRGKTAVRNNDGEKRLSYPALERLTVSDSREPSSNRNSDYNF